MAIDFGFTDEHEELRATIRQFLADNSDEQAVRTQMASESGYDTKVWEQLAEEMGLAGLIIPEDLGGAGMSYVELCVVMEEMGRALLCAPFLSTGVLAPNAIMQAGTQEAQQALLPGIAAGETTATLAFVEPNGRWDLGSIAMTAGAKDDGWLLDGTKRWVLDGHTADILLVAARTDAGLELFRVDADAAGLTRTSDPALDLTRKLATVVFESTPATKLSDGDQTAALERALSLTVAALTVEQVGGAQACLDMAVDYAKNRLQFGRPIGSYQAIKHKCADLLVEVEFARSAAYNACFGVAAGEEGLAEAAALAKSYCSETYYHAAAENIQIHGGMGFTWEHPAHLYFKRAKASEILFGDPSHHREVLAAAIGV